MVFDQFPVTSCGKLSFQIRIHCTDNSIPSSAETRGGVVSLFSIEMEFHKVLSVAVLNDTVVIASSAALFLHRTHTDNIIFC